MSDVCAAIAAALEERERKYGLLRAHLIDAAVKQLNKGDTVNALRAFVQYEQARDAVGREFRDELASIREAWNTEETRATLRAMGVEA